MTMVDIMMLNNIQYRVDLSGPEDLKSNTYENNSFNQFMVKKKRECHCLIISECYGQP